MNSNGNENPITKVDFVELIQTFRNNDVDVLTSYLIQVWKDLRQRSNDPSLGINKHTFFNVSYNKNYTNISFILFLVLYPKDYLPFLIKIMIVIYALKSF